MGDQNQTKKRPVRSPQQMWFACKYETVTHQEVLAFTDAYEPTGHDFENMIYEVYGQSEENSVPFLLRFLQMVNSSFELKSEIEIESEAAGAELLLFIDRMLAGEISQSDFCGFFMRIESLIHHSDLDFFVGDLYNGCDVFDKDWRFLPNDYLLEEAQRVRSTLVDK